jgi:hypothetical protein
LARSQAGSAWLNVFLRADAVNQQLAALLGAPFTFPWSLRRGSVCKGYGQSILWAEHCALRATRHPSLLIMLPLRQRDPF